MFLALCCQMHYTYILNISRLAFRALGGVESGGLPVILNPPFDKGTDHHFGSSIDKKVPNG